MTSDSKGDSMAERLVAGEPDDREWKLEASGQPPWSVPGSPPPCVAKLAGSGASMEFGERILVVSKSRLLAVERERDEQKRINEFDRVVPVRELREDLERAKAERDEEAKKRVEALRLLAETRGTVNHYQGLHERAVRERDEALDHIQRLLYFNNAQGREVMGEPSKVEKHRESAWEGRDDEKIGDAIWRAIKGWDLEREPGAGYAGTTGTDVVTILDAIRDV